MRHLPNLLTLLRIILIVALYIAMLYVPGHGGDWLAFAVFMLAAATDYWDGWIARRFDLHSSFGRMLDPIADKLIVATCLMLLVYTDIITAPHLIAALIILCREIVVSGLRAYLSEVRVALPVSAMAKYKTSIQMLALAILLTHEAGQDLFAYMHILGLSLLWLAAVLTLITGYGYLRKGLQHT